jgi:hypothetical protein
MLTIIILTVTFQLPIGMSDIPETPSAVFATWLSALEAAMTAANGEEVSALFLPHGWLRDILTFSWDLRAIRGPSMIAAYVTEHADAMMLSNIKPDNDPHLRAHYIPESDSGIIEAAFSYETRVAYGRGYVQLAKGADSRWNGLLVCMTLTDFKGHEEPLEPLDWEAEANGRSYTEFVTERHKRNETDPYVLIGQLFTCE